MNEYDSSRILDLLKKSDYEKTENAENADCYLINTCHIREKATEKVFHDVGRIKKNYRNKKKTNCFNSWLCCSSRRRDYT